MSQAEEELKKKSKRLIKWIWLFFFFLVGGFLLIFFGSSKNRSLSESEFFTEEEVRAASEDLLDALDTLDMDAIYGMCDEALKPELSEEGLKDVKVQKCAYFGERKEITNYLSTEVGKDDVYYAVTQLTVEYENVNVTYTFSFNTDMKVTGLYIK